jgi:hypothetical protein
MRKLLTVLSVLVLAVTAKAATIAGATAANGCCPFCR